MIKSLEYQKDLEKSRGFCKKVKKSAKNFSIQGF